MPFAIDARQLHNRSTVANLTAEVSPMKSRTACLAILLFTLVATGRSAEAAPFTFSFSDDPSDYYFFHRAHVAGTVTGILHGLSDNGTGLLPTSIEFTSDVSFLGMTDSVLDGNNALWFWDSTGFTIVNGEITGGGLGLNFVDPVIGNMQFRLNGGFGEGYNILHWNGSTGPVAGTGNQSGFAGATYRNAASVPEPSTLGLLALGLATGAFRARRRRTAAAA